MNTKQKPYIPLILGAILSLPLSINSAPALGAHTSVNISLLGTPTETGDGPVTLGPLVHGGSVGYGFADYGKLGSSSAVDVTISPLNSGGASVTSTSSFELDDLVFSGPGSTVSLYLNMRLSGVLGAYYTDGAQYFFSRGRITCKATMDVTHTGEIEAYANPGETPTHTVSTSGFLSGAGSGNTEEYNVDQMVTIGPFNVATNQPVSLSVQLISVGHATSPVAGNSISVRGLGTSQFENTFKFPESVDVFDLPAGYSVDSAKAGIVANRWINGGQVATDSRSWGDLKALYR